MMIIYLTNNTAPDFYNALLTKLLRNFEDICKIVIEVIMNIVYQGQSFTEKMLAKNKFKFFDKPTTFK